MSIGFDSYAELQASLAAYLQRTNLTAQIPLFIQLAEVRLKASIETMEAQMSDPWIIQPAVNANVVSLPTDCASVAKVKYGNHYLRYVSPENISAEPQKYGRGEYSTLGGDLYLETHVDGSKLLSIYYFREITSLSDANPSNWLLEDWPNVYLYASLVEAAKYLMDDERLPMWMQAEQTAIEQMKESDKIARYPSRSKLITKRR